MKYAIEAEKIGKSYVIDHKSQANYGTLKDDVGNIIRHPFSRNTKTEHEKFWALKDVSFKVNKGEVFGIIGRNGSGKSTLLKILSRIVDPTEGSVIMRGRTASLLEVGTGFHPELTGRENVFLNGSMLGMRKQEIAAKFDEIVDFSEISQFIDTPVKFYSSGMYVRLAFSVAAHLDPDILILDEVLSVGDAAFQKKSLKKILSTLDDGRTVLFVSHSVGSIRELCSQGILLNKGHVEASGDVGQIIDQYMLETMYSDSKQEPLQTLWKNNGSVNDESFTPQKLYLEDSDGRLVKDPISNDKDYWVCLEGEIKTHNPNLNLGYSIWDRLSNNLFYQTITTDGPPGSWPVLKKGKIKVRGQIPKYLLNVGDYKILGVASIYGKSWIFDPEASPVRIETTITHGSRASDKWPDARGGFIAPIINWELG